MLTVGTLLRTHTAHDLNIHVGIHSNYAHYTNDLSLFEGLRGLAQIHLVDEIDWMEYNACVYRYSLMHAKNITNLLKQVQYYDFDYLLLLDNDVYVKVDFVTTLLSRFPKADLIGAYFEDSPNARKFTKADGQQEWAMPKMTVWHLLISNRLYRQILKQPNLVYPKELFDDSRKSYLSIYDLKEDLPVFIDTMSDALHFCRFVDKSFNVGAVTIPEFEELAHHYYHSSFNYGSWSHTGHGAHVKAIIDTYHKEFPNGLKVGKNM